MNRVGELEGDVLRREIRLVIEHLCDSEDSLLNRNERERLIDEVLDETFGLGPLEVLLKDTTVCDILINGRLVAEGEVLVLNDYFCVRVTSILSNRDRAILKR